MWIDTHCHLQAEAFDTDRSQVVARARACGVQMMVLPSVEVGEFDKTAQVAHACGMAYALGLHPLYVQRAQAADIETLRGAIAQALADPRFVAVGEIGLDYFEPGFDAQHQQWFYREQLKLARDFGLPVLLHVRRSADDLLKWLRRIEVPGGIVHAFNGSMQQAQMFGRMNFRLGFGGAMTFEGSQRIRRLAREVPADAWVLETDAPDMAPQWLRNAQPLLRNAPEQLPRIAQVMSELRGVSLGPLAIQNQENALSALPRLRPLL
ncbi:MAG TPA: TatD family hydrolase [Burkholderiaceae bacterium]|nr:TatD family hydrolase [Burkholderiaceae bacterium]